mmetsp:Transcript_27044/g.52659  ORF Transcript_27044/g.52659 Transcript_27044/m.52659 type:complete len:219 (-) Transcript_27044:260-916(-)
MVGIHRTRNMAERYSIFSQNRPHTAAAFTASAILGAADVSSQFLQHWIPQRRRLLGAETKFCRDMSIDWRRTAGLTTFGFIHYGGACKWLYLWYDRLLGTAPTLRNAAAKMVFDVYVHSPFLLVPCFYIITGSVKGQTPTQISEQLRSEWLEASLGTALLWTPMCFVNFYVVPQHSRILVVSFVSFAHKTWLSWLSNQPEPPTPPPPQPTQSPAKPAQ